MIACVVALALVAPAGDAPATEGEPAAPQQPAVDFDAILRRAEGHFQRGEYLDASAAFGEAYAIDPRPEFLYARAQAERLGGRCDAAVEYYDKFLQSGPPTAAADEAKINRSRCTATEPPPVPPPRVEPSPDDTTGSEPRMRKQWVRDPAGGVLVALGGVTSLIGASLIGISVTRDRGAEGASSDEAYLRQKKTARIQHTVGIVATAIGGAMLVAGITRWSVLAARERRRVRASINGDRRGAAISVSVWF